MFSIPPNSSHEINPIVGARNENTRIYLLQLLHEILNTSRQIEAAENHPIGGWFVSKVFDMNQIRVFHENTEYVRDCFESVNVRSTLSFFCPNVLLEFAAGLKDTLKTFTKVAAIVTEAVGSFRPGQKTWTFVVQPAAADPISYIAPLDLPCNEATGKYILCWNLRAEVVAALTNQLVWRPEPLDPPPTGVDSGSCHNVNLLGQLEAKIATRLRCPQNESFMTPISRFDNAEQATTGGEIGDSLSNDGSEAISVSQVTSITPMDNSSYCGVEAIDGNLIGDRVEEETEIAGELEGWNSRNPLALREEGQQPSYRIPQSESPNIDTSGEESDFGEECSRALTPPTPSCNYISTKKKVPFTGGLKEHQGVLAASISTLHLTEEEIELVMAIRIIKSHGATEVGTALALLNRYGEWKGLERLLE